MPAPRRSLATAGGPSPAAAAPHRVAALAMTVLAVAALAGLAGPAAHPAAPPEARAGELGRTLRVPSELPDLEAAIAEAAPGDVILLAPGTYPGGHVVPDDRPGITIRGEDRNRVVFDGEHQRRNAIEVVADGVTLENMSAHSFTGNGFYWTDVEGYAGRYLTVWNVGLYGIYAIESRGGVFEHSLVSGAGDAAFYVGECFPCDATIRNVTGTLSAVGFSGTNAGGNLVVEDSRWILNFVGLMPNSYDVAMEPPPQRAATFRRNEVVATGTVVTPRNTPLGGFHGIGIAITGGLRNEVQDNDVRGSTRYGIAIFTAVDRTTSWVPSGNQVTGNRVSDSGIADLALADRDGGDNCFQDNEESSTLPVSLDDTCSNLGDGDPEVHAQLVRSPFDLLDGLPPAPDYSEMDPPGPQPTMPPVLPVDTPAPTAGATGGQPGGSPGATAGPGATAAPSVPPPADPAVLGAGILAAVAAAVAVAIVVLLRRRREPS